jgi:hypothetical protein
MNSRINVIRNKRFFEFRTKLPHSIRNLISEFRSHISTGFQNNKLHPNPWAFTPNQIRNDSGLDKRKATTASSQP